MATECLGLEDTYFWKIFMLNSSFYKKIMLKSTILKSFFLKKTNGF
jgi:hypothetical protein